MVSSSKFIGHQGFCHATLVLFLTFWSCHGFAHQTLTKAQYKKTFSEALSKMLSSQKTENVCLPPMYFGSGTQDSIELNQRLLDLSSSAPTGQASQLKALEEAGLVTSIASERMVKDKPETFRTYRRTEKGNRYFSDRRLCYARAELNKIVKWKGPAVFGEYKIAWVYYTIKVTDVAEWATLPEVLAAFPTVKSTLHDDPNKVRQAFIDLTSEGWEVNEWSKVLQ